MNIAIQNRQHRKVLPAILLGTVTRIGYYRDTLPKLIITVKKEAVMDIPLREGERLPVPFVINGKQFTAGVRTTKRSPTVMICPDLNDSEQNFFRLTDLLYCHGGIMKNSRIELVIENGVINCMGSRAEE